MASEMSSGSKTKRADNRLSNHGREAKVTLIRSERQFTFELHVGSIWFLIHRFNQRIRNYFSLLRNKRFCAGTLSARRSQRCLRCQQVDLTFNVRRSLSSKRFYYIFKMPIDKLDINHYAKTLTPATLINKNRKEGSKCGQFVSRVLTEFSYRELKRM